MNKKAIQLTEQDLHMVVEEAVKSILAENGVDEGALWNAFKNKGQQIGKNMMGKAQQFGQGVQNMGKNMMNTYQTGRQDKQLQQLAQQAKAALKQLVDAAANFNPGLSNTAATCMSSIDKALAASAENLQNVSQNTFSTQAPQQQQ